MTGKELTLKDYVEGRFDRLVKEIDEKLKTQQEEFLALTKANDVRYQQRFEAQGKELDKAFAAAKEAVASALSAADKAAAKTEQTADKRFADLGELIKEQFKGSGEKLEATIRRIEVVEQRLNLASGNAEGKTATWAYVVVGISIIFGLAGIVLTSIHMLKP